MKILIASDHEQSSSVNFCRNLGKPVVGEQEEAAFLRDPHGSQVGLLVFTGGADVSPHLYGHRNLDSHTNPGRDIREQQLFQAASDAGIPMTGYCRGAQLLTALCGGTLVQNLGQAHGNGGHWMLCRDSAEEDWQEEMVRVTSAHHQMCVLPPEAILLGISEVGMTEKSMTYDGQLPEKGVYRDSRGLIRSMEAFAIPDRRIFAVQSHPEWQALKEPATQWTLAMIRRYCLQLEERSATA